MTSTHSQTVWLSLARFSQTPNIKAIIQSGGGLGAGGPVTDGTEGGPGALSGAQRGGDGAQQPGASKLGRISGCT